MQCEDGQGEASRETWEVRAVPTEQAASRPAESGKQPDTQLQVFRVMCRPAKSAASVGPEQPAGASAGAHDS